MANGVEEQLANSLRLISKKVREWEQRDVNECIEEGSPVSRAGYHIVLDRLAAMLDGTDVEHRLRAEKPDKGRPRNIENVDRDLSIAALIDEYRKARGKRVGDGVIAAMERFNVSEGTAKAADRRMRHMLLPGSSGLIHLERLVARGLVIKTKRSKK